MDLVTDDIEYWDPTLSEPVTNIQDYAVRLDRFFGSISGGRWKHPEAPLYEELDERRGRASETWVLTGINTGELWTGHQATGRQLEMSGVDIYEFRNGRVCRQYSYFDVLETLRQLGIEPEGSFPRGTVKASFGLGKRTIMAAPESERERSGVSRIRV